MDKTIFRTLSEKRELSYRRFKRLSEQEKLMYMKSPEMPRIKRLGLKYQSITRETLERSIQWARNNFEAYSQYLSRKDTPKPPKEYNTRYIIRELKFRGFVPESQFQKKEGFNYIITLPPISGWIYPAHLSNNYYRMREGYENPYDLHDEIALDGVTHIDIKYTL